MRSKGSREEEVEGNEGWRRGARRGEAREKNMKILTAMEAHRSGGWSRIQRRSRRGDVRRVKDE